MAVLKYTLLFAMVCVSAFGQLSEQGMTGECEGQECKTQSWEEEDAALSLLQSSARVVKNRADREGWTPPDEEVAYMNVIRHGEKCISSGEYLLPVGYERADYIGRCMGQKDPSIAMPFGRPTAILVGAGEDSIRPMLTALPLAERLNLTLNMPCNNPLGAKCLADNIPPLLTNKGTLVVVDVYQMIPYIFGVLNIPGVPFDDYKSWPYSCPSSTKSYKEPACCAKDINFDEGNNKSFPFEPVSLCFDQIWQVKWTRPRPGWPGLSEKWIPRSLTKLAEGFGGTATCPCKQDLAPCKVVNGQWSC